MADQQVDELVDALNRHNGPEWVSALEVVQLLEALSRAGLAIVPAADVPTAEEKQARTVPTICPGKPGPTTTIPSTGGRHE